MTFVVHLDQKWTNAYPENEAQQSLYATKYELISTQKCKGTQIAEMLAQISLQQPVLLKRNELLYFALFCEFIIVSS